MSNGYCPSHRYKESLFIRKPSSYPLNKRISLIDSNVDDITC